MNSSKQINKIINNSGNSFWQRNYYEHIIRNESALQKIQNYIIDNPRKWHEDHENPDNNSCRQKDFKNTTYFLKWL